MMPRPLTGTTIGLMTWGGLLAIVSAVRADDWPGVRGGPRRDAVSRETGLLKSWPEGGPRRLWKADRDDRFGLQER